MSKKDISESMSGKSHGMNHSRILTGLSASLFLRTTLTEIGSSAVNTVFDTDRVKDTSFFAGGSGVGGNDVGGSVTGDNDGSEEGEIVGDDEEEGDIVGEDEDG